MCRPKKKGCCCTIEVTCSRKCICMPKGCSCKVSCQCGCEGKCDGKCGCETCSCKPSGSCCCAVKVTCKCSKGCSCGGKCECKDCTCKPVCSCGCEGKCGGNCESKGCTCKIVCSCGCEGKCGGKCGCEGCTCGPACCSKKGSCCCTVEAICKCSKGTKTCCCGPKDKCGRKNCTCEPAFCCNEKGCCTVKATCECSKGRKECTCGGKCECEHCICEPAEKKGCCCCLTIKIACKCSKGCSCGCGGLCGGKCDCEDCTCEPTCCLKKKGCSCGCEGSCGGKCGCESCTCKRTCECCPEEEKECTCKCDCKGLCGGKCGCEDCTCPPERTDVIEYCKKFINENKTALNESISVALGTLDVLAPEYPKEEVVESASELVFELLSKKGPAIEKYAQKFWHKKLKEAVKDIKEHVKSLAKEIMVYLAPAECDLACKKIVVKTLTKALACKSKCCPKEKLIGVATEFFNSIKDKLKYALGTVHEVIDALLKEKDEKYKEKILQKVITDWLIWGYNEKATKEGCADFANRYIKGFMVPKYTPYFSKCKGAIDMAMRLFGIKDSNILKVGRKLGASICFARNQENVDSKEACAEFAAKWVKEFAELFTDAAGISRELTSSCPCGEYWKKLLERRVIKAYVEYYQEGAKLDKARFKAFYQAVLAKMKCRGEKKEIDESSSLIVSIAQPQYCLNINIIVSFCLMYF
eukprot:TRINITY_DN825_c0_g1_i15.p1 TRINITY_DN825_c0_g1~~TRINITY_DN825_c0_g1_i15.p1  ORF type:complete len:697 (+),score=84.73 TRINITY_DN825_c0_g1_i15:167-2257(+)